MRTLLSLYLAFLFFSCGTSRLSTDGTTTPPPTATSAERIAHEGYRATYSQPINLLHTTLRCIPDWTKNQLLGNAEIQLKAHFAPIDSIELNARGMAILRVGYRLNEQRFDSIAFEYDSTRITFKLKEPLHRSDTLMVNIDYIAKPDELKVGGSDAINSDKGLYFINTDGKNPVKPKQLWTQGETESNSVWFPTIESPAQKMTQDIYLTVDTSLITLSNGLLLATIVNGDGTKTDHWKQSLPAAPYLTMIAVGPFSVVKDSWRGKEVSYYLDKPYEKYARKIFGETPAMIEFFSNQLGVEYPWEKYSQVVVHDYVSGAMENTTATVHGTNMQQDPREMLDGDYSDYISHELFHHWFGDLVTCESWSNITLNEGFANYSEYLWREHRYGKENADCYFQGEMSGYLSSAKRTDPPLIRFNYKDREDVYDAISYNKGGRVLHMLRKEIGDTAFFAALKDYLTRNAYQSAEIHDLRKSFELITGQDLNWFFNQWFMDGGHPSLKFSYQWIDSSKIMEVNIEQAQDLSNNSLYRLPISVDIYLQNQILHESIVIERQKETFRFPLREKPQLINTDADKVTLCTKKDNHTHEEWRYLYEHGPLYMDRWEAIAAISKDYKSNSPDATLMAKAINDPIEKIRIQVIDNIGTLAKKDSVNTLRTLQQKAVSDSSSAVRRATLKALKKYFSYSAISVCVNNCINDSSYDVVATAFEIIAANDSLTAVKYAGRLENDSVGTILSVVAEFYANDSSVDRNDFYWRAILQSKSWERFTIIKAYGKYLTSQKGEILETGIQHLMNYCDFTSMRFAKSSGVSALRSIHAFISTHGGRGLSDTSQNELKAWLDKNDQGKSSE